MRIIATTAEAERLRGALVLAAAQAALGGEASLFLQLDAVALLRPPVTAPRDEAHQAAGLPSIATLIEDALALGVTISVCQSGMALAGLSPDMLPAGMDMSGPVAFLQQTGADARLLVA